VRRDTRANRVFSELLRRRQHGDFCGENGVGGNDAGDASLAVAKTRRDLEASGATDTHTLDAVEETAGQSAAVDGDRGDERLAFVLEPRDIDRSRRHVPAHRFAAVQPQTK